MAFNLQASSLEWAWRSARMISLIHHDAGLLAIRTFARSTFGDEGQIHLYPGSGLMPSFVSVRTDNDLLLFLNGCPSFNAADLMMGGYLENRNVRTDFGFNRTIAAGAQLVVLAAADQMQPTPVRIGLAGHSYGGACAFAIATALQGTLFAGDIELITFGAPKATDRRGTAASAGIPSRRYMIPGDPIPLLPPTVEEGISGAIALLLLGWGNASEFIHPIDGWLIDDAAVRPCSGQTVGVMPDTFGIQQLGWATGLLTRPVHEHSISSYETRLLAARSYQAPPSVETPTTAGPLQAHSTDSVGPASYLIPSLNFFDSVPGGSAAAGGTPPVGDLPGTFSYYGRNPGPSRTGPYYGRKIGSRSYVCWQTTPLFGPMGPRSARKIASRMNRLVRQFNSAAERDPAALESSVANEFQALTL